MNDQNKKKIYIGVIAACLLVTGYIIYNLSSGGEEPVEGVTLPSTTNPTTANTTTTPRSTTATRNADPSLTEYTAPSVFPNDNKFQTQVFNSSKYQELTDYPPATVTPEEVGRDDLFAPF